MSAKIVISGATGRMGQTLVTLIKDSDLSLAGGIGREPLSAADAARFGFDAVDNADGAGALVAAADVVIDFSSPDGLNHLIQARGAELAGKGLVVGTTGLSNETHVELAQLAQICAVIVSANYSIGVNLMMGLVEDAARVLSPDRYDVEIIETHHRNKADAPSGTALMLGRAIAEARRTNLDALRQDGRSGKTGVRPRGQVGFHAVRGGEVVGEHRVMFLGASERFEIVHAASDRGLFAEGALLAARWLAGRGPGSYSMKDVLGI